MEEFQVFCEQIRDVKLAFRGDKEMQEKTLYPLSLHTSFQSPREFWVLKDE